VVAADNGPREPQPNRRLYPTGGTVDSLNGAIPEVDHPHAPRADRERVRIRDSRAPTHPAAGGVDPDQLAAGLTRVPRTAVGAGQNPDRSMRGRDIDGESADVRVGARRRVLTRRVERSVSQLAASFAASAPDEHRLPRPRAGMLVAAFDRRCGNSAPVVLARFVGRPVCRTVDPSGLVPARDDHLAAGPDGRAVIACTLQRGVRHSPPPVRSRVVDGSRCAVPDEHRATRPQRGGPAGALPRSNRCSRDPSPPIARRVVGGATSGEQLEVPARTSLSAAPHDHLPARPDRGRIRAATHRCGRDGPPRICLRAVGRSIRTTLERVTEAAPHDHLLPRPHRRVLPAPAQRRPRHRQPAIIPGLVAHPLISTPTAPRPATASPHDHLVACRHGGVAEAPAQRRDDPA